MIDEIIGELSPIEYERMMIAFEEGTCCIIDLPEGKHISVNKQDFTNCNIIAQNGVWCYYGTSNLT
jgi:hypothetical protein